MEQANLCKLLWQYNTWPPQITASICLNVFNKHILKIEEKSVSDEMPWSNMKNDQYSIWPNLKTENVSLSPAFEIQTEKEGQMEDRWYYTNN